MMRGIGITEVQRGNRELEVRKCNLLSLWLHALLLMATLLCLSPKCADARPRLHQL
jgi:hypothetical protein